MDVQPAALRCGAVIALACAVTAALFAAGCMPVAAPAGGDSPGPAKGGRDAALDAVDAGREPDGMTAPGDGGGGAETPPAGPMPLPEPIDEPRFFDDCPAVPAPRHASAPVAILQLRPQLGDQPLELGASVDVGGRRLRLSTVRMFISHVVLRRAGKPPALAELVDETGKVKPHGVHLVDLDDPPSLKVRVRAPAGQYDQITWRVGLPPACNLGNPAAAVFPLNADGGMTWIWSWGYVLLKIEGTEQPPGGEAIALAAHGGLIPPTTPPPRVVVSGGGLGLPAAADVVVRARFDDLAGGIHDANHLVAGVEMMTRLAAPLNFLSLERP
jgi:hypothetical protein